MNIRNFINLINEEIINSSKNITNNILTQSIKFKRFIEFNKEIKKVFTVKIFKALTVLLS